MPETKQRKWWLLPTLAVLLIAGAWFTLRLMFPPFAPPVLPVPNGYDELIGIAMTIPPRTGFYDEMEAEELAAIVEQNRPALEQARRALQNECMVAVDWNADQAGLQTHMDQGASLRGLARAFAAAARQANSEGRTEDAVQYGLDMFNLAAATSRGGLLIDRMLGGAIYYTGLYSLREQVPQLTRDDCARLQKKIQVTPLELDEPTEIFRREMAFARQLHGQLQMLMMSRVMHSQKQDTLTTMAVTDKRYSVMRALLQTHIALRAFQLDHEKLPAALDELVPDYLSEVPRDAFATGPVIYRPEGDSYQLYSVGTNGVDDGGVETTGTATGDLLLELHD